MATAPAKKRNASASKKTPAKKSSGRTPSSKKKPASAGYRRWGQWLAVLLLILLLPGAALSVYVVYLDNIVQTKFAGNRWSLPARVYAQPLELYQGLSITPARLEEILKRLGYQSVSKVSKPGQYARSASVVWLQTQGFRFWDGEEASIPLKVEFQANKIAAITHTGRNIAWDLVRLEPEEIGQIHPAQYEDRLLMSYQQIPKQFVKMLVAVEDKRFYQHWGVDFRGLARAMWVNLREGHMVQGGSTLTQQLAKNFLLTPERTLSRKFNEVIYAGLIEWHYQKQDIIEAYCNQVFLGQQGKRAIHGFQLASEYYFGRRLEQLSIADMAMLVGMVKGPSLYHPVKHPKQALARREVVLKLLASEAVISAEEAKKAAAAPLPKAVSQQSRSRFPAFMSLVQRQLIRDYSESDLKTAGLKIFTTLVPTVQQAAEQAVVQELPVLEGQYHLTKGKLQSAVLVVSPQEGEVMALVGGREPRSQGFNRALDAYRGIGSLIKPAVYLTALQSSSRYTLTTLLDDSTLSMKNPDGTYWEPKNYDNATHGQVPLFEALAKSYNLATIRLGQDVGIESVILTLRKMGLERPLKAFPSLLLGTPEMSPYEVAQMYQTFASGGYFAPLRAIRSVLDAHNQPLTRYPLTIEQRFEPGPMILINRAMQAVVDFGSAKTLRGYIDPGIVLAGKTGTTNDSRDSWFAGFGGDKVGVVWVGFDDNQNTHLTGARGALKIWGRIMQQVGIASYALPSADTVHWLAVDPNRHMRVNERCEEKVSFPYIVGSEPKQLASCASKSESSWFEGWFN